MANLCRGCRLVVHRSASNYVKRATFASNSVPTSSGGSTTPENNEKGLLKTPEDWMRLQTDSQERKLLSNYSLLLSLLIYG